MATLLKEVDAVVIGVGWTGSILARELTKAGLSVVGLVCFFVVARSPVTLFGGLALTYAGQFGAWTTGTQ